MTTTQLEQAAYAEEVLRGMVGPEQARTTMNYLINQHPKCDLSCDPFYGYGTCF